MAHDRKEFMYSFLEYRPSLDRELSDRLIIAIVAFPSGSIGAGKAWVVAGRIDALSVFGCVEDIAWCVEFLTEFNNGLKDCIFPERPIRKIQASLATEQDVLALSALRPIRSQSLGAVPKELGFEVEDVENFLVRHRGLLGLGGGYVNPIGPRIEEA